MKVQIIENSKKIRRVEITIKDNRYHIQESVNGTLIINKPDLGENAMMVFPRYTNEIEIK